MNSGYIVEDHTSAQRWLRDALEEAYPGIDTRIASTLEEAHKLFDSAYPDLALIDLNLPDGSGIDVIERLHRESRGTVTVVATIYDDDDHLFPALRAGAKGYILKEQRKEEISRLLRGIVNGDPPLSPAISQRLISYFSERETMQQSPSPLTEREQQVLAKIAQGHSLNEVASMLGVTRNTIASQVKSIYSKLDISSRAEAAIVASKMGIIDN